MCQFTGLSLRRTNHLTHLAKNVATRYVKQTNRMFGSSTAMLNVLRSALIYMIT
jgi:hypothetical protein